MDRLAVHEVEITDDLIMGQIYVVRGQKIMLDKDLALLYGVTTKVLNQAVRRNLIRFPTDFMFELTVEELDSLRSQFVTLKKKGAHSKYLPLAFTEQGIAMLSSVLNSNRAILVNIQVIRIFTHMRQLLADTNKIYLEIAVIKDILQNQDKKLNNHDKNIEIVFKYLDELLEKQEVIKKPMQKIGYKIGG